jgi:hypothetical protein
MTTPFDPSWAGGASGNRFYLQNMLEAMDEEGEFYLDRNASTVQFVVVTVIIIILRTFLVRHESSFFCVCVCICVGMCVYIVGMCVYA